MATSAAARLSAPRPPTSIAPDSGAGATSVAPPPPMAGGGGTTPTSTSVAPAGGGSWRPLSDERKADLALAMKKKTGGPLDVAIDAARRRQGLDQEVRTDGHTATRDDAVKPTEAIEQEQTGNVAAIALAGAGVVGTGIAIVRGGAWWLSLLLLPAAGAAYYLSRYKVPAPVTS